ncbi:hypothetical protein BD410DRAFT_784290 [Rickenella mellea]|uniref:F-box domain-containing protein n=1 Tax=Rickenella mellea TaxID=50990 RepID=A0A4Y7QH83_9AGAM|nr:hypothetical protein BD410DRAFT_784290 [Rickenella mellea]
MMTSLRSARILDSDSQRPLTLKHGRWKETRNSKDHGHSKYVESISNISQCIQSNAAVWEMFDSISPSESATNFQCPLDLPELVQSLKGLERSLDELDELRVQMRIRILGLETYCAPLLLTRQTMRTWEDLELMPDEILADIFQAGHDMDQHGHYRFALSVSQVSRRFRDVALNTPRLWTRLWLEDHPLQVFAFLARSSTVSALEINAISSHDHVTVLSSFLNLLVPHSNRWLSLRFKDNKQTRLALHSHTNIQLPNLRHIEVLYDDDFNEVAPLWMNWAMPPLETYETASFAATYFCPELKVTECKLVLAYEALDVARLAGCLTGMKQLQTLTLDCLLSDMDVVTVLTIPTNPLLLSLQSLTLRLSCMGSNRGALFKYLESIYAHMQFRGLCQLKMTLDPMYGRLADLNTAGLSPYPSKIENVALEIDSKCTYGTEPFGDISHLLPGITDIGELCIDTLQSSLFESVNLVASPTARTISFKGCGWLSEDKLSQMIRIYVAEGNVRSLNIIACKSVSQEFIRGNPMRAKMKMDWSLH